MPQQEDNITMKIICSADTHLSHQHLYWFLSAAHKVEAQCLIIGGDIIPVREWKVADSIEPQRRWLEETFLPSIVAVKEKNPALKILLDFGNDDLLAARSVLEAEDGKSIHLIHNRIVEIAPGVAVVGQMAIPPTPFMLKDWERPDCGERSGFADQEDVRRRGIKTGTGRAVNCKMREDETSVEQLLAAQSEELRSPGWRPYRFFFVSHCPPRDTALDTMEGGKHVGSLAIRRFIEQWAPTGRLIASLHGHIHEAPEITGKVHEHLQAVPCFNMGQKKEQLQCLLIDLSPAATNYSLLRVDVHSMQTTTPIYGELKRSMINATENPLGRS